MAHAILGAAVSYATGNSATVRALSGATSEAVVKDLSQYLYSETDPKNLNLDQKDTLSRIITLAATTTTLVATDGSVTEAVNAGEVGRVAVDNNWGEVGHYSTTSLLMFLGGFPKPTAEAIGNAAWAPDTDERNAMSFKSLFIPKNKNQEHIHLLDGISDPEKIIKQRIEFENYLKASLSEIYQLSKTNPDLANSYLQNKNFQNILHAYGDSFAHVNKQGEHYSPFIGHAHDETKPDNPNKNPRAYFDYVDGLSSIIQYATNNEIPEETKNLIKSVSLLEREKDQKNKLREISGGQIDPNAKLD